MKILPDGTVVSSNTIAGQRSGNRKLYKNFKIEKAIIVDVMYAGEKRNLYGLGTEYDVLIVNGPREGERLTNVLSINSFGGLNNFCEWVYNKRKVNYHGNKNTIDTPSEEFDNAYVIVGFLGGHYNSAVILGGYPHPGNTVEKPQRSDGEILVGEFNGLRWKINDDGELIITYYGGKRDSKNPHTPIRDDTAPTEIKIDKDGKLFVSDNKDQKILIDRVSETIRIENPEAFIQLDIPNKTIEVNANQDVKNISGEQQINEVGTSETNTIGENQNTTVGGTKETTVEGTHTETVKDNVTNNYQKDVTETIGQKWQINITGDVDLNSGGKVTIDASSNVEIQGNSKDVVTTGSYDPFLMAPHVQGYNKIKAGG